MLNSEETKFSTTKADVHQQAEDTITQNKHEKMKAGFGKFAQCWPGNRLGLFLQLRYS